MDYNRNEATELKNTYKDSIFCQLFSDKENLIELYNALFDADYPKDTPVNMATIEDVTFKKKKNDIAFDLEERFVVIIEHQSSLNGNMDIRELIYYVTILQNMFENKLFHRKTSLKLPTPHFVVLYNGKKDAQDHFTLTLSDHYIQQEENPALQLMVEVYNGLAPICTANRWEDLMLLLRGACFAVQQVV